MKPLNLIKVGGAELTDGPELDMLSDALAQRATQHALIVVHGGGSDIAALQQRLGIEPCFVDGLRVTDEASMWVCEMVLSGAVNKRLTARLVSRGVRALGLSGVDAGLLRAQPLRHPKGDLGRVGEIVQVNTEALLGLLAQGFMLVISPVSLGLDGRPFNVNADHAALAIAGALGVDEVTFLTNVPGVLCDGTVLAELDAAEAQRLIANGQITGGMIPKVESALRAVAAGARVARICNLAGFVESASPTLQGVGTCVTTRTGIQVR